MRSTSTISFRSASSHSGNRWLRVVVGVRRDCARLGRCLRSPAISPAHRRRYCSARVKASVPLRGEQTMNRIEQEAKPNGWLGRWAKAAIAIGAVVAAVGVAHAADGKKPNILIIWGDDIG